MTLRKKLIIGATLLLLAGGGTFFYLKSIDHYDPSKYSATVTGGLEHGGLQKGTKVGLTLPDQFDVSHTIGPEITTVVFAFSKTTGSAVRDYLDKQHKTYLRSHNALFVADISSLPVVVRNTFALPLLRNSSYPVLLIYDAAMAKSLMNKQRSDDIAVATLVRGVVQSIRYVASDADLASVFQ